MSRRLSTIVTNDQLNKIMAIESAGKPKAKAPTSSAGGLFQFISTTWSAVCRKYFPSWLKGRSAAEFQKLKFNPDYAIPAGVKFTEDNAKGVGKGFTDGDLYLAHFLGLGGAKALFHANQSARCEPVVGAAAVKANRSILAGKTCGQVRAWAQKSMDSRWAKLGRVDFIAKYLGTAAGPAEVPGAPNEPLAPAAGEPTVVVEPEPTKGKYADAMSGEVNATTRAVQKMLSTMGYFTGNADGRWGTKTHGMVSAFMKDRHVSGVVEINAEILDALILATKEEQPDGTIGWKRPIAKERAEATDAELKEKLPEVKEAASANRVGFWGSITGTLTLIGSGIIKAFGDAWGFVSDNGLVSTLVENQQYIWFGLAGVGVLALIYVTTKASNAKNAAADAFREGARA